VVDVVVLLSLLLVASFLTFVVVAKGKQGTCMAIREKGGTKVLTG
jgi:hypothetical protein